MRCAPGGLIPRGCGGRVRAGVWKKRPFLNELRTALHMGYSVHRPVRHAPQYEQILAHPPSSWLAKGGGVPSSLVSGHSGCQHRARSSGACWDPGSGTRFRADRGVKTRGGQDPTVRNLSSNPAAPRARTLPLKRSGRPLFVAQTNCVARVGHFDQEVFPNSSQTLPKLFRDSSRPLQIIFKTA